MQFQKKEKRQTTVRFDSHHVRLRTGEVQRKTGSYMYRWTDKLGKRNTIYAATLEDLREQEEQILVDQHDGIKANIKNVTVNDVYELWCQLKRGIKDSTMKNYIYMYELFVKPTFGKKKLVQVKKSDVRRFYNQLIDDKVLKPSTVDVIHNIVHQVFQIAVDDDMIRSNPAANMLREIKMAHGSEIEKRKALTLEQEELFLGYLARTSKYQHYLAELLKDENNSLWAAVLYGIRYSEDQIVTVALSQVGNVGGEPYWSWYGFGSRVEWCACFVSWCADQCGYIDTGVVPKYAGCVNGVQWFKDRGQWIDGSAEPVPGMIIFFDWDNKGSSGPQDGQSDHTGIVQKVENGIVYTVEGNSGDSCRVNQYSVGHYEILGYGVPNY